MSLNIENDNTYTVKLAAAFQLLDAFSLQPILNAQFKFSINHQPYYPLRKSNGYYIFHNLLPGEYTVLIESFCYFPYMQKIVVLIQPVLPEELYICNLVPRPYFPFPIGFTLLEGCVSTTKKPFDKIGNVSVMATINKKNHKKTIESLTDSEGIYKGRYVLAFYDVADLKDPVNIAFIKKGYQSFSTQVKIDLHSINQLDVKLTE